MKKKILYFIMIFAAIAAVFALASCGKKNNDSETTSETTDIVAELPYINDFKCAYYDVNGEKIEDKSAVLTSDELRVKTNFTLLPDAYAEGKGRFTLKFILSADFVGKIVSANSSATSDKDLTATFTADDKNSKNCEIELRIKINYSTGSFKIVYAYDDEVYTEACELPLNNNKTLLYTYDEATDGYIVSHDPDNYEWLYTVENLDLNFPDSCMGKPVTAICDLFQYCEKNVTRMTIPDSIKSIRGDNDKTALIELHFETATVPVSLLPRINTLYIKNIKITGEGSIGERAFYDNQNLTKVELSDGIKNIAYDAFTGCTNLKYNEYGNALYLGNAKNPYLALIKAVSTDVASVDINDDTKIICDRAFYDCVKLKSLSIPDGVTNIGRKVFYGCRYLQYKYDEFNNICYLGNEGNPYLVMVKPKSNEIEVFDYSLEVNEMTKIICGGAFESAWLTSAWIPDNVISVGDYAFAHCDLKEVFIPDSVIYVGEGVFYQNDKLSSVRMGTGVTRIGKNMFFECSSLTNIEIPDSVTSIESGAFFECDNLTSITIPNGVTSIGNYAFQRCFKLTDVTIPECMAIIGKGAFNQCSNLTSIAFTGTKNAWLNIFINGGHATDDGKITVKCSDGELKYEFYRL